MVTSVLDKGAGKKEVGAPVPAVGAGTPVCGRAETDRQCTAEDREERTEGRIYDLFERCYRRGTEN